MVRQIAVIALLTAATARAGEPEGAVELCAEVADDGSRAACAAYLTSDPTGCADAPFPAFCTTAVAHVALADDRWCLPAEGGAPADDAPAAESTEQQRCLALTRRDPDACRTAHGGDAKLRAGCEGTVSALHSYDRVHWESQYRDVFRTKPMSTTQELAGITAAVASRAPLARVFHRNEAGEEQAVLQLLTTTPGPEVDGTPTWNLALVTSPAELGDVKAWAARQEAAELVRGQIQDKSLKMVMRGDTWLVVDQGDVVFHGDALSPYTGKLATITIPDSELSRGFVSGSDWYKPAYATDVAGERFKDRASATKVYVLLASMIGRLGEIDEAHQTLAAGAAQGPTSAAAQDRWGLVPQTPANVAFRQLADASDQKLIEKALAKAKHPHHWKAAAAYVLAGGALTSSVPVKAATVGGEPAMQFQYRASAELPPVLLRAFPATDKDKEGPPVAAEEHYEAEAHLRTGGEHGNLALASCDEGIAALMKEDGKSVFGDVVYALTRDGMRLALPLHGSYEKVALCGREVPLSPGGVVAWTNATRGTNRDAKRH